MSIITVDVGGLSVSRCFNNHGVLTDFCEGQNTYLPERFIDVLRHGDECSQHGLGKGYPTRS